MLWDVHIDLSQASLFNCISWIHLHMIWCVHWVHHIWCFVHFSCLDNRYLWHSVMVEAIHYLQVLFVYPSQCRYTISLVNVSVQTVPWFVNLFVSFHMSRSWKYDDLTPFQSLSGTGWHRPTTPWHLCHVESVSIIGFHQTVLGTLRLVA
jgi:hypothetical protein